MRPVLPAKILWLHNANQHGSVAMLQMELTRELREGVYEVSFVSKPMKRMPVNPLTLSLEPR